MSVVERAEKRLNDEIRQHELGLDNVDDIQYWAAYLDGARAQKKDAAAAIEALQAQLPKQGEWIDGDARRVTARCSVCGHLRLGNGAEWANKHVHFCEVCGSRMGDEKA